ncbi:MAG: hypothetical protein ACO3HT_10960, partial [Ilumatobacteraceae bacterium]
MSNETAPSGPTPSGKPVATAMSPVVNGFAFANFAADSYEVSFAARELVDLFGDGPDICSAGAGPDCQLTAEAAAFAQMVNQARAGGHCEGFSVVAAARFNADEQPVAIAMSDDEDTLRALMRGF